MSNVRLIQSEGELSSYNFFDIGIVREVVKKPISEFTDEEKKKYRVEAQDQVVNLYNVELTTRSAEFKEIPLILRKNDVVALETGDQVLVGYLGINKFPFIMDAIIWDMPSAKKSRRISVSVEDGEKFINVTKGNSIHFRKDGAIVVRGGIVGSAGSGISNSYFIIGGNQGVSKDGNIIIISTGIDQLGDCLTIDALGNTYFNAQNVMNLTSGDFNQWVGSVMKIFVGNETGYDATRQGTSEVTIGKEAEYSVGEKVTLNVGDVTKDDKRKTAEAEINIARKCKFKIGQGTTVTVEEEDGASTVDIVTNGREVKIDDNAKTITIDQGSHKIVMNEQGIYLGEGATELLLKGFASATIFNAHVHPETGATTGPPATQIQKPAMSSEPVKVV